MKSQRTHRNNVSIFEPLEGRQMMSAGDLDLSFGIGGKVLASDTVGFQVADMAVQADGKIIAVGSLNNDFAVARLNTNGKLDRSFGGGDGIAQADFQGNEGDFANAVAIQSDGKIVVAGERRNFARFALGDQGQFAVARFNVNGSLDNTFDGNGTQTVGFSGDGSRKANAVLIQSDGRIVVAGTADTTKISDAGDLSNDFAIARLMPNGSLDSSFDGDGKKTIGFGGDENEGALALALGRSGKIVVGGIGGLGIAKFAVARLNSNGSMDSTFTDGISGDGKFNNLFLNGATFKDMHVASADQSVTIVGGINGNFMTVRLTSAGRLDRSFNGTGRIVTDFGSNDEAKHVRVNRQGILVTGGSNGKFAMVRYLFNGQRDVSFGQGGKVVTTAGPNDAILTTTVTSDGKFTAYGRNGSAVRYFAATPIVEVLNSDTDASEAANQPGRIVIKRDAAYEFSTRVFLDISSPATLGVDYTSPQLQRELIFNGPNPRGSGSLVPVQIQSSRYFVDIPAGHASITAQINVKKDNTIEHDEVVRWAPTADASYQLGAGNAGHVTIHDNTTLRVNFQAPTAGSAFAFEPDLGLPFGLRQTVETYENPLQFGWDVDNTANARVRATASAPGMSMIYTTFNHMQKPGGGSKWEFALPNGMYQVKLAAGDPERVDSVYKMNLEGQLALSGTPSGLVRWFERTVNVQVNDGRLTLTNAAGASNNKIDFIEIKAAAPGSVAGAVTDNLPVRLPPSQPVVALPTTGERIFSQLAI